MDFNLPAGDNVLIPKKGLVEVAKFLGFEGPVRLGIKDRNFIVKKEKETKEEKDRQQIQGPPGNDSSTTAEILRTAVKS